MALSADRFQSLADLTFEGGYPSDDAAEALDEELFFERAVIEISPRRAFLWEDGRTDRAPQVFELAGVAR